jgi:hypothetical protein
MEAARSSETLVSLYHSTRYYIPEDCNLECSYHQGVEIKLDDMGMGEIRNAYKILVGEQERRKLLGRPRLR